MAHIGRTLKNVEAPRPLKSRSQLKNNYILIEELIQLLENVAVNLASGAINTEPMATLVQNLRIHGPQLESVSKDTLDRAFVVFRNASQDERFNIMTRLNLLELIELRAKGWEDNGLNLYYKSKGTNVELPADDFVNPQMHHVESSPTTYLSTSPSFATGAIVATTTTGSSVHLHHLQQQQQQSQQQQLLAPGEIIRNSGKFPKPTKIPGKTYCKDEVVIRNADSGKVMGIKGRRVHMIEELSETIISFQRVNPGAKERLVQITGPAEDKINYAKQLIEDTIRRNASPVRLDHSQIGGGGVHSGGAGGGSCSSLASSASDEAQPRSGSGAHGQGKLLRPANQQQMLPHSFSTNDASLREYEYTVWVGENKIKITGDSFKLVEKAKYLLDDYFSNNQFFASSEAAYDGSMISPISTPGTPMSAPQFMMGAPNKMTHSLADSGIGLNYMSSKIPVNSAEGDDDVFVTSNAGVTPSNSQNNGLSRSRRSHFSRKDSITETATSNGRKKSEVISGANNNQSPTVYISDHLLFYAKSPHSWALPADWQRICEKFPSIIRNKVIQTSFTNNNSQQIPTTITTTTTANAIVTATTTTNVIDPSHMTSIANTQSIVNSSNTNNISNLLNEDTNPFKINIKRQNLFNREIHSIEQEINVSKKNHINNNNNLNNNILQNSITTSNNNNNYSNYYNNNNNNNNHYNNNNINCNNSNYYNNNNNSNQEENLLKKQIKMIEAITESGGGTGIGNNFNGGINNRNPFRHSFDIDETDENVETLTNLHLIKLKTKLSIEYPFRTNSICN